MSLSTQFAPVPILINDEPREVASNSTVFSLIGELHMHDTRAIAVAVNGIFIRRADWPSQPLTQNDHVFLVRSA